MWPEFWSYFTGAAFIAAGLAMITGVFARLAATLVTVQIALLTLIVWVPRIVTGQLTAFQWGEVVGFCCADGLCVGRSRFLPRHLLARSRKHEIITMIGRAGLGAVDTGYDQ
jgi:hypothetical protein